MSINGHRTGCHCETCFQLRSVVEKTAAGVEELTTEQIHKARAVGMTDLKGCLDVGRVEIKDATIELMGSTRGQAEPVAESHLTSVFATGGTADNLCVNHESLVKPETLRMHGLPLSYFMPDDAPVIDAAGKVPSGMPLTVRVDVTASMVDSGAIASHVAKIMDSVAKRDKNKLATSTVQELKPLPLGNAADWAAAIHALNTPSLVMQLARRRLGDDYTEAQLKECLTGMPQMHMGDVIYPSQKAFSQQKLDHLRDLILPSSRTRPSQSTTNHEYMKLKVRDAELAFDELLREVDRGTVGYDKRIQRMRARHADMIEELCEMKGYYQ